MIETKTAIVVSDKLSKWIDFVVIVGANEDYSEVEEIIQSAYDAYWETCPCNRLADFISNELNNNEIEHDIYHKQENIE